MAMAEHSILVGKSYRTPDNEVREVSGMDKGDVVYRPVAAAPRAGRDVVAGQAASAGAVRRRSRKRNFPMPSDRRCRDDG